MPVAPYKDQFLPLQMLALAAVAVASLLLLQGNDGFDLWDEGFLWYGVQRVMLGEIPIRDFMAYDPGRYYWAAALMKGWGSNGILALRGAVAIFQILGLAAGLLLIARQAKRPQWIYLLLSVLTLLAWMYPRHKLFDISVAIFLVVALASLVEKPTAHRYFLAGMVVGLAAVFGRNHGLYGAVGSLAAIGWLGLRRERGLGPVRGVSTWAAGVLSGYAPLLLMLALIPGFAGAFWESIRFLFELKGTNLPLPVPWPWLVDYGSMPFNVAAQKGLAGLFFVGLLVFGVISAGWVVRKRLDGKHVSPPLVAAACLTLPYAHFAFSRPDVGHLAQGIFPALVGTLVVLSAQSARVKWAMGTVLCAASVWLMSAFQPAWECRHDRCVDIDISNSRLQVGPGTARDIGLLRQLAGRYAPDGGTFITVPFWPGAYALLERKAPMWEIYPLFPRRPSFERDEIERIKKAKPGFALVYDMPLDGREALRFRNTHPLTYQYIRLNFEPVDSPIPAYEIYRAKEVAQ